MVVVRLDRDENREGLLARLRKEGVKLDGVEVKIDGVESNAVPVLAAGTAIGLRIIDAS